jgi:hypothetical protein
MAAKPIAERLPETIVTVEEVNRLLDVGRLLLSVLTSEELDQLQQILSSQVIDELITLQLSSKSESEMGNASVT